MSVWKLGSVRSTVLALMVPRLLIESVMAPTLTPSSGKSIGRFALAVPVRAIVTWLVPMLSRYQRPPPPGLSLTCTLKVAGPRFTEPLRMKTPKGPAATEKFRLVPEACADRARPVVS